MKAVVLCKVDVDLRRSDFRESVRCWLCNTSIDSVLPPFDDLRSWHRSQQRRVGQE